jgi:capsular polysaccharide export protein
MKNATKRKLMKLFRNPKQYFIDMKLLQPMWRALNYSPYANKGKSTALPVGRTAEDKELFLGDAMDEVLAGPVKTESNIVDYAPDFHAEEKNDLPVAVVWNLADNLREAYAQVFSGYRMAFANVDDFERIRNVLEQNLWCAPTVAALEEGAETDADSEDGAAAATVEAGAATQATPGPEEEFLVESGAEAVAVAPCVSVVFLFHADYDNQEAREYAAAHGIALHYSDEGMIASLVWPASFVFSPDDYPGLCGLHTAIDAGALTSAETRTGETVLALLRDFQFSPDMWKAGLIAEAILDEHPSYAVVFGNNFTGDDELSDKDIEIIRIAQEEHPSLHVVYIPHLACDHLFVKSKSVMRKFAALKNTSVHVNVSLSLILKNAEYAYTRSSGAAVWALVYDVPVTVFEETFYSGVGLTDDRYESETPRPRRALAELLYLVCIQCATYISESTGPEAFIASVLKIKALAYKRHCTWYTKALRNSSDQYGEVVGLTEYWPLLIEKTNLKLIMTKHAKTYHTFFRIIDKITRFSNEGYRETLCDLFGGLLLRSPAVYYFLKIIRPLVSPQYQMRLIQDIYSIVPSKPLTQYLAWCYEKIGNAEDAKAIYEQTIATDTVELTFENPYLPITSKQLQPVLNLAEFEIRQGNLEHAKQLLRSLVITGWREPAVLENLARIAKLRFSFHEAAMLYHIITIAYPSYKNGLCYAHAAECEIYIKNYPDALQKYVYYLMQAKAPAALDYVAQSFIDRYGDYNWQRIMKSIGSSADKLGWADNLIRSECFEQALQFLLLYKKKRAEEVRYHILLSQAYIGLSRFKDVRSMFLRLLDKKPCAQYYNEAIRAALYMRDYDWATSLYNDALAKGFVINEAMVYRIKYITRQIHDALVSITRLDILPTFPYFLKERYAGSLAELDPEMVKDLVVLADSGVGDEIRGASLYRQIVARADVENVVFTCDARLLPLFARSFPELDFFPFERLRHLSYVDDFSRYSRVPSSEFQWIMDNSVWARIERADKVVLHTHARVDVVQDYADIRGTPFLKPDPERVAHWKSVLRRTSDKPLVGLCWRTSLRSYLRNMASFQLDELTKLLDLQNVQLVNCQYDGYNEAERTFLERHYPGRLLEVEGLDQYNDLDDTAAFYACLDGLVAPPNSVMELAGSLGVPTLMFTCTYEPDLLKIPSGNNNIYYHSVEHVGYDLPMGQHEAMIDLLVQKVSALADR